jgi:hypothetical protein
LVACINSFFDIYFVSVTIGEETNNTAEKEDEGADPKQLIVRHI